MLGLKSIKLYFFSIFKLSFLSLRNYYFQSKFYNNKLVTYIPTKILYAPSSYLSASLTTISSDFYKITDTSAELLWKTESKNIRQFDKLHNFLWLTKLILMYHTALYLICNRFELTVGWERT